MNMKNVRTIHLLLLIPVIIYTLLLSPSTTRAQGSQTFGGYIFSLPCICEPSISWVLAINPTVGGTFDYQEGTQMYLGYMLPYQFVALGWYTGGGGMCYMGVTPYCYVMPSQGLIDPVAGSSES